jgi:hypothetical protein
MSELDKVAIREFLSARPKPLSDNDIIEFIDRFMPHIRNEMPPIDFVEQDLPASVMAEFMDGCGYLIDIRNRVLLASFGKDDQQSYSQAYYYVPETNTLLVHTMSDAEDYWDEADADELVNDIGIRGRTPSDRVAAYLAGVKPSVSLKEDEDGTVFKIVAIPIPDLSLMTQAPVPAILDRDDPSPIELSFQERFERFVTDHIIANRKCKSTFISKAWNKANPTEPICDRRIRDSQAWIRSREQKKANVSSVKTVPLSAQSHDLLLANTPDPRQDENEDLDDLIDQQEADSRDDFYSIERIRDPIRRSGSY